MRIESIKTIQGSFHCEECGMLMEDDSPLLGKRICRKCLGLKYGLEVIKFV